MSGAAPEVAVVLFWTAPPGMNFEVELSSDFARWSVAPAEIREAAPGQYRGG